MNEEIITVLADSEKKIFIDCTVGLGGHSYYMLKRFPHSQVIAVDVDGDSLERAKNFLAEFSGRIRFFQFNFLDLPKNIDFSRLDISGVLVDPGLSMFQIKKQGKGFSHHVDSGLDMRKEADLKVTARDVVNSFSEARLSEIFRKYGELKNAHKLAKRIIERRLFGSLDTTFQLKEIVEDVYGKARKKGRTHPAAKVFQALRIFVNRELEGIDLFLQNLPEILKAGARILYLTYHSLEDRIVKQMFTRLRDEGRVRFIKPFPMFPSEREILRNPASRSAKLRAVEVI
jgi:16S rRNA (cytosine1402-N4)-methyltransferase